MSNSRMSNATRQDVEIVSTQRIACDGGGVLGHPKVWLDMGHETEVECKYCDRVFRLQT